MFEVGKKKKFKIKSSNPRVILLLLLTMTSYVVAVDFLEGINLTFRPHQSKDIKVFHHTLNETCEANLFYSEIDFIFEMTSQRQG